MTAVGPGSGKKILIVEDKLEARKALVVAMRRTRFDVLEAARVSAALSIIDSERPAVVLTDIILPGDQDGLEFCRQIKANPQTEATYVIVMSGLDAPLAIEQARTAGANAYMIKPFRLSRLFHILENFQSPRSPFLIEKSI